MKTAFLVTVFLSAMFMANVAQSGEVKGQSTEQRVVMSDIVKKLRADDDGLVVLFERAKGAYYLQRTLTEFDSFRKKLEQSMTGRKPVSVTVETSQLNILEVK